MNESLDEERRDFLLQALSDHESGGREESEYEPDHDTSRNQDQLLTMPPGIGQLGRTDSNITVIPASISKPKNPPNDIRETEEGYESLENHILRPLSPRPDEPSLQPPSGPRHATRASARVPDSRKKGGQISVLSRAFALYDFGTQILANTTAQLARNPAPLLRFVLFLVVLVGTFGRTDLRERLKRAMRRSLGSVRHTLGMGFKASSI